MLKQELVATLADKAGLSKKQANEVLDTLLETIKTALSKGDRIMLTGFGTFEVRNRAARKGINPKTLAPIQLPASKVPAFKAGKALKDAVK